MSSKYFEKRLTFSMKNLKSIFKRPSNPINTFIKYDSIKFPMHLNLPLTIKFLIFSKFNYL